MELRQILMDAMAAPPPSEEVALDAAEIIDSASVAYAAQSGRLHVASAVQEWAETEDDDLDEGENLADRLYALLAAAIDSDGDEDLTDEDQDEIEALIGATEDYLLSLGIDESDVSALLDDWSGDAAARVRDALAEALPEGDEALDSISAFAFDPEVIEATLDAAYRKMVSFVGGKRTIKRRRVSGRGPKLSAKQKAALRRARKKANNSQAKRRRAKSMSRRMKSGVGMKRKYA
jgi:hypothetical protein